MKLRFRLFSALVLLGLLVVLAGCSSNAEGNEGSQSTVRIGIQQSLSPLWIAKENGWFEEAFKELGVEVEWVEFQSGPPQFEGIAAGKLDFTDVGNTPVIGGQAADVPFKEIAVTADGMLANAILVNGDSGIKTVEDLKGKKIAVAKGSSAFGFLYQVLKKYNIDPSEVEIIQLQPDEATPAFENGSVDAWSIWEPFISIQTIRNDAEILINGKEMNLSSPSFAVARQGIIDEHPEFVSTFLEVYARAAEWRTDNKEEAIEFFSKARELEPEVVESVLNNTNYFVSPITDEFNAGQQKVADLLFELGAIEKSIDTSKAYDNEFAEKLQKGE
ncbi:aliphatic sulfonate ABC transporter substrate-binding protein [Lysinibacillus yapensis]|uniref:Putative aliphatic sulfonates-binding protein n=1 Tax=Ureibacillus yapensis TaxID=2304605 RepID=A0A396SDW9_9BACL|nr:aliphatic sulfonate ABC transporter substrate-binding protein [Lysinibacillus yapensis]RHW36784.1 aliphatic sulfonate ABC transporter substrate-binding protein [Lysinibacillus yapensis]